MTTLLSIGSGHDRHPACAYYAVRERAWAAWGAMRSLERDDECEATARLMLHDAMWGAL